MKTLIKTLLILYNVIGSMSVSATDFNPLNYKGNENKYDVVVPKITEIIDNSSGVKIVNCVHPVQQAKTYNGTTFMDLVYLDTSTNPATATTTNTGDKVLVQKYSDIADYESGNPSEKFQFDNDGLPIITKVLKSDFLTPYLNTSGNEVFRQKIKKSVYDSDIELQFSDNSPVFIMDGSKEKQAVRKGTTIPLVSYMPNANEVNIRYSQNISIQSAQPSNYDLAYNASGLPIVVNCSGTFLQKSQIENLLSFDSDGNPIFKALMKQAKTNPYSSPKNPVYVTSEGYVTTNSISNGIANLPVLIQKNTETSSLSYDANTITFPNITKALKRDSSEYMESGKNVYIQTDSSNSTLSFDENDNPVFDTEKKQATVQNSSQLVFTDGSGNVSLGSGNYPVYIQQYTGSLKYDNDGTPIIQQATFQDGTTPYQESLQNVYIQSITDGSTFIFDGNNPVFETVMKQAKTNPYSSPKNPVYVTSEGYMTINSISNGIANSPVLIQKNTDTSNLSYDANTITFPNITKALKQDSSEYMEGGKNVYIQTDSNNSTLSFDESGNPVFDTEIKQATKSDNVTNVFIDNSGNLNTTGNTPVYIQEISDSDINLAYDGDGMPLVTKAFTSNRNIYPTPYTCYYRQLYENEPKFEFDNSGNPVKATENDGITLKIATTQTGNTVYVISEDENFTATSISDEVAPILIQQWYPDGDDTYKSFVSDATDLKYDNNHLPVIKKVLNKDGTDYTINGVQVYRQITIYEDNFKFYSDGNPIFLEDQHLATPFIMEGENIFTEVDNTVYEVGELVEIELVNDKKVIKQKCKTNNIPWYDLENYIIGYFTKNPTSINQGAQLSQDTNFIVKNDYHFANGVSFLDAAGNSMKGTLFVPDGVTLFLDKSPDHLYNLDNAMPFQNSSDKNVYNVYYWNFLLFGRIVQYANSPSFSQFNQDYNCISVFAKYNALDTNTGTIEKPKESIVDFFNGGFGYLCPIIYPNFILNDNILDNDSLNNNTDNKPYSDPSNATATLKVGGYVTIGTNGIVYLNRFQNNDIDKAKAKKIKATMNHPMDIVLPSFLETETNLIKNCTIGSQNFEYIDFFPNLLWFGISHDEDTKVPMNYAEITGANKQNKYYFEDVYAKKIRLWEVQFIPDNNGRNVLNNVTIDNPFAEYDAVFYSGIIEPTIEEGEKPEYHGQSDYNPSENRINKYWDASTVNNLFGNGESYNSTGVTNNLPGELNIGLIDEDGTHNVSTTKDSLKNGNTIQLNGDDKYYNGTYIVPAETTQVNLNNKTAILKINKEEGTLSDLTYNAMTGIDWEINRTGDDVVSDDKTTGTLKMNIKNENSSIITFTDSNNKMTTMEFTGDNTSYNSYIIIPNTITVLKFNHDDSNEVNNAVLKILTGTAKACITTIDNNNIIIKKYEDNVNLSSVNKIVNGETTYVKQDNGSWDPSIPGNLNTALFEKQNSSETYDKRDNIRVLNATYQYNKSTYYFNTATEGNINKIDTCFEGTSHDNNDSNASKNMPTVINTGLINNGDIKIVNNDIENNTTVEFNGKNNGHESGNDIGTPFVGTVTIPVNQNIDTIQFGNNSFIANIVKENKEPYTNLNYFFEKDTVNTIKKFPVNEDNEFDNTKTAEKLSLNLLTMDVGHYDSSNTTGNTTIENTNINVKTFKVRKGMTVTLQSGSHISVRTPV